METLKLKKAINIDGKQVKELTYDTDEITYELFEQAAMQKAAKCARASKVGTDLAEFDAGLHLYIGCAAIIAVNPDIDWVDLERITGTDLVQLMNIGRFFMMSSDESINDNSDEHTETTPELSTAPEQSSKK